MLSRHATRDTGTGEASGEDGADGRAGAAAAAAAAAAEQTPPQTDAPCLRPPRTWMQLIGSDDASEDVKKLALNAVDDRMAYFYKMHGFVSKYLDATRVAYTRPHERTWKCHVQRTYNAIHQARRAEINNARSAPKPTSAAAAAAAAAARSARRGGAPCERVGVVDDTTRHANAPSAAAAKIASQDEIDIIGVVASYPLRVLRTMHTIVDRLCETYGEALQTPMSDVFYTALRARDACVTRFMFFMLLGDEELVVNMVRCKLPRAKRDHFATYLAYVKIMYRRLLTVHPTVANIERLLSAFTLACAETWTCERWAYIGAQVDAHVEERFDDDARVDADVRDAMAATPDDDGDDSALLSDA